MKERFSSLVSCFVCHKLREFTFTKVRSLQGRVEIPRRTCQDQKAADPSLFLKINELHLSPRISNPKFIALGCALRLL